MLLLMLRKRYYLVIDFMSYIFVIDYVVLLFFFKSSLLT